MANMGDPTRFCSCMGGFSDAVAGFAGDLRDAVLWVRQKNPRRGFSRWGRMSKTRVFATNRPFTGHTFSGFGRLKEEAFSGFFLIVRAVRFVVRFVVGAAFLRGFRRVGAGVDGFELLDAGLGVDRRGFKLLVA